MALYTAWYDLWYDDISSDASLLHSAVDKSKVTALAETS